MYVSAPWGIQSATSLVWRSDDGGRRFVRRDGRLVSSAGDPTGRSCAEAEGGADADLAVDRNGRLYVADLGLLSVSAWASVDHGDTWTCETAAGSGINDDRPWVTAAPTADGSGPQIDAYLAYLTNSLTGQAPGGASFTPAGIRIDVTRDGGRTWTQRASYGRGLLPTTGPIFTAADGTVYEVFAGQESVWIARSRDQGRSFAVKRVALRAGSPANTFVSGAVYAAGNVYAAWVDYGTFDVVLSRSTDNGEHWSLPRRLNPPASETAVMPWVAAGRNGDVAVAWYGAAADARPDAVPATTPWNVWVARTLDATSAEPSFRVDVVTETPMHFGVICLRALQCTGDSNLADFFEIAIDRSGAVVAVFDDNAPGGGSLPDSPGDPFVTAARQVSGLGMTPAAPPGPAPSAGRDPVPEATFASMPSVSTSGKTLRLTFALRSAKNLTGALAASDTGAATDAYWIAVWKAAGKVEYAGMHMDRTGTAGFFGGDACAYVFRNSAGWTTYPATFTLAGRVDKGAGTVTIDVPLAAYHLKAGDLLHGLQAFSLTGSVPSTVAPLHLSDSTPAWTAQL